MTQMQDRTALAVIVTVVDGGAALTNCLQALALQEGEPELDVIVPYDDTIPETGAIAEQFPAFRFLNLGRLADPPRNEFERHAFFDRRRAAGLREARAPLVAIIEDRGAPRPDWARAMIEAHARRPDAVIGGPVEIGAKGAALWAIYFVDFGRYQAPFDAEHPEYVTDTNIAYKREALEAVRHLWAEKYQEPAVNWALKERGYSLCLTPEPRTVQRRTPIGLAAMASERFHWGRLYGMIRSRGRSGFDRLKWSALTPLLPFALYLRNLRRQLRLKRDLGAFALATPAMFYLHFFWSLGELAGYAAGGKK